MKKKVLLALIMIVSIALRLFLIIFNNEDPDFHTVVVEKILEETKLPHALDCAQCYQPKLFHVIWALLAKISSIKERFYLIKLAQLMNLVAGVITLLYILKFLKRIGHEEPIIFMLIALNPSLIAINAEPTNDSLAILLSTIAIFHFFQFNENKTKKDFFIMSLAATLGVFTKGTVIVVLFSLVIALLIEAVIKKKVKVTYFILLLAILFFSVFFSEYYYNLREFGNPFLINLDFYDFPNESRTGVVSISDTLFTFRILDLIEHPADTINVSVRRFLNTSTPIPRQDTIKRIFEIPLFGSSTITPLHRTSLFSQLYGKLNFVQFVAFPAAWQTNDPIIMNIGRVIFVLALVPLFIFLNGLITHIKKILDKDSEKIFLILFLAEVCFIIYLTLAYRDYQMSKVIYLMPAGLAFIKIFCDGFNEKLKKTLVKKILVCLVIFYVLDIIALIVTLWQRL
jgi:4-amino-4-deoxy-L-arabinose transferase-like glycosyltransferase